MPHGKDSEHIHHPGCGHDHHDHDHTHSPMDENLNYPFHYHYELQKQMEGVKAPTLTLPDVMMDATADDVSPAHSRELTQFIAGEEGLDWVYLAATLNDEGDAVLYPSATYPESESLTLDAALEWLIDNGINTVLMIAPKDEGDETECTAVILDTISRIWDEDCPTLVIGSAHPVCLATAQEIAPYWPKALRAGDAFLDQEPEQIEGFVKAHHIGLLILDEAALSEERITLVADMDIHVGVMMDDNVLNAKRYLKWGVSTLICPTAHILNENL